MPLPKGLVTGRTAKLPLQREMQDNRFSDLMITLPLPPKQLSPNARCHWAAKAKAVSTYRSTALNEAVARTMMCFTPMVKAKEQSTFYFKDKRTRDADNLLASLKSAFDGLADAGVLANDSGLTHLPVVICYDKEYPRVEIRLWRQS